jgi:hypothetical protein
METLPLKMKQLKELLVCTLSREVGNEKYAA